MDLFCFEVNEPILNINWIRSCCPVEEPCRKMDTIFRVKRLIFEHYKPISQTFRVLEKADNRSAIKPKGEIVNN